MKKYLLLPIIFAIAAYVAFWFIAIAPTSHRSEKYRLMCWLPNAYLFYNGYAENVHVQNGAISFSPLSGPQIGHVINTTTICTWMKAE